MKKGVASRFLFLLLFTPKHLEKPEKSWITEMWHLAKPFIIRFSLFSPFYPPLQKYSLRKTTSIISLQACNFTTVLPGRQALFQKILFKMSAGDKENVLIYWFMWIWFASEFLGRDVISRKFCLALKKSSFGREDKNSLKFRRLKKMSKKGLGINHNNIWKCIK